VVDLENPGTPAVGDREAVETVLVFTPLTSGLVVVGEETFDGVVVVDEGFARFMGFVVIAGLA